MEPGTPFALLSSIQLLSVACCLALAGGWFLPGLRTRRSGVVALGASILAAAETASGVALGSFHSPFQFTTRLIAGGLIIGGAIGPGKARIAAVAGGVVALVDGALGPTLYHHPVVLLSGRAVAAVLFAAAALSGIRRSVLGKVVAAILVGVVVTSVGAAVVAGTALSRSFGHQQVSQVASIATTERTELLAASQQALNYASLLAKTPDQAINIARALSAISSDQSFSVTVTGSGATALAGSKYLDNAALVDLSHQKSVTAALSNPKFDAPDFVLVRGKKTSLLAIGVVSSAPPPGGTKPALVAIYAIPIDGTRLGATAIRSQVNLTVLSLPDGGVVATNVPVKATLPLVAAARSRLTNPPSDGVIVSTRARGSRPAISYTALDSDTQPLALLIASQSASIVFATQKLVLEGLFGALVGIAVILSGFAFFVGRRLVDPIQRLTHAATAIRLGNAGVQVATDSPDEVGELARAFGEMTTSLTDATEQLRTTAQQEAEVRARLQTVLDSMAQPLLVLDHGGRIIDANPAAVALIGSAMVGKEADKVLITPSGAALLDGGSGVQALAVGKANLAVQVSAADLPGGAGRVVVLRDVSAEHQVERMKTEFLSNVSHELRTPLTPIKGYAEMLARRDLPKEKVKTFASTIVESTQRMTRVVDLLVDVAALEAGRVEPRFEPTAVASPIEAAVERWSAREPSRAGDLRRRVSRDLPHARIDAELFGKALDEVIGNAVKFSKKGSLITIAAGESPRKGHVRISVTDKGAGMTPVELQAVTADFSQVDASVTRSSEGLGLGLGFVRRLASVIDIQLSIESVFGKGTTVHLDVPATRR